ncbi:MAG TPA: hypothetical protein VNO22_09305 [Planctomycetota bacterium]|jgi:hypothetical protein|nr:hypothetical protein [Planctomycetota bacterium]
MKPPVPPPSGVGPLCRACRRPADRKRLVAFDHPLAPGVFERAHVCPHCRAVLEFSAWRSGPPLRRRPR